MTKKKKEIDEVVAIEMCGGKLHAWFAYSPKKIRYSDPPVTPPPKRHGISVSFTDDHGSRRVRRFQDIIEIAKGRGCSLPEAAMQDPESFARIVSFVLSAERPGRVMGGPSFRNDFLPEHFDLDPAEQAPRVIADKLHFLLVVTAWRPGWPRPTLPHERRVMSVTVDLITGDSESTEIPRVRG